MIDPFLLMRIDRMEDFWKRRVTQDAFSMHYNAYGHAVHFTGNVHELLESANLSARRYSQAPQIPDWDIHITVIQDPQLAEVDVPENFPAQLHYQAVNTSILFWGMPWVYASADLNARTAVAVVSSTLAHSPVYLSRFVLDTITLNMLIHTGVGQLHASCLFRDGRAVLLSAPHNTGKSTTAFGLVRHGYQLVSDGMSYVKVTNQGIGLMGYPVGEIKLRMDVVEGLSELNDFGESMLVREATKMVYNLRHAIPDSVIDQMIYPREIKLCLLERTQSKTTRVYPLTIEAALEGLWQDAAHYDDIEVLSENLRTLRIMLKHAQCYRLVIGNQQEDIVRVVDAL